jgi:N-acetylneuraminic acid mutarotase
MVKFMSLEVPQAHIIPHRAAAVNGKIYVIGGALNHPGSPFGTVEEYDPSTDSWDTDKTPMPTARKGAAWGVISNKIYVAGGTRYSNYSPSDKLEIYDPSTDTWDVTKATMPKAVYDPAGTVINDTFYVIGGLIGSPWVGQKTVQIYDIATDSWSTGADLIYGRPGHTADVLSGKIYVIGGDPQSVMIRDQTPHGITVHTSTVFENKIYVISGSTNDIFNLTPTTAVYSYDPMVSSVPQNNFMPGVFVLHQNYPNPFNPRTIINYELPTTSYVELTIYNMLGQKVATLVNERQQAGNHQVEWDAGQLSSGVYYYRIEAGEFQDVKKMILLR